ncbi:hypothetical protein CASFOL_025599 [Castilleja foliolosa]|uniref:Uncharacterized protein n=1 Tax=Castilleja foliolosa TaxID=1961234 RepID=A0ABD3CRM0_9LAMI
MVNGGSVATEKSSHGGSRPRLIYSERVDAQGCCVQIVNDGLMMDGNPRLNLASFVTMWMEPECDKLIMAALNKNYVDMDEYPVTTELQIVEECESRLEEKNDEFIEAITRILPPHPSHKEESNQETDEGKEDETAYLISVILFWRLKEQVDLMPPSLEYLQFCRFLKNGFLLITRVIAVRFCVTLSASMAARLGPTQMAAFQVCLQVWLATSLLADGLAVAGQAILATAFARKDYMWASATVSRVLQLGLVLGLVLAIFLGFGLHYGARIFTRDEDVLRLIGVGIRSNSTDKRISLCIRWCQFSMVTVAIISIIVLLILSSSISEAP